MKLLEHVEALFKTHPEQWIDGRQIASVGGAYAWRTRISECRQVLGMRIENRIRRDAAKRVKVSEYRYTPQ